MTQMNTGSKDSQSLFLCVHLCPNDEIASYDGALGT
jgi:hypothetical protein